MGETADLSGSGPLRVLSQLFCLLTAQLGLHSETLGGARRGGGGVAVKTDPPGGMCGLAK